MMHSSSAQASRMTSVDPKLLRRRSTKVSWLLRHGANESGLAMADNGFCAIADVLRLTRMSRLELDEVVAENNKTRFQVNGERIRAVQGHSLEGTPVTLDGLERSWNEVVGDDAVFHGTSVDAAFAILDSEGVHAAARTHVHLAAAADAVVGKRHQVDVLLAIEPRRLRLAGQRIFRAPNGVLLTRAVPVSAVVDVIAQSRRGDEARAALLTRLKR